MKESDKIIKRAKEMPMDWDYPEARPSTNSNSILAILEWIDNHTCK